jgi:hypothetical protein
MDTVNQEPWGFVVNKIVREVDGVQLPDGFCMYPEERLGMHSNSASMMWERIEALFQGVRSVMRDSGRARSGSFNMEWSVPLHEFWKVIATLFISLLYESLHFVTCNALITKPLLSLFAHRH